MKINHLTAAEENLMKLFWQMKSFYLKDIMAQHTEPKPHQNTVSTYLKILIEKEFLAVQKEGRIFRYSVAVPIEVYQKFVVQNLISGFFEDNADLFRKFLTDQNIIKNLPLPDDQSAIVKKTSKDDIKDFAHEILNPKKDKKAKDKKKKKNNKKTDRL